MSQPANTPPIAVQRLLARQCTRCGSPAADDDDECAEHAADTRARKRRSAKKRRAELRRKGRCIDCGRKAERRRCRRCYRRSRGVDNSQKGVDNHWRTETDVRADRVGQTTQRYVGKARRGRLTREEQIDEDARDARFAIEEVEKFIAALGVWKRADVQALPRIQLDATRREVMAPLAHAARFLDDLLDKYGG